MKNLKFYTLLALLLMAGGVTKAQQLNEPDAGKSQDNSKSQKDLYLSYFGNVSTNINIMHVPCESADLGYLLSGVIYANDTITINGKRYYYRVPQSLGCITEPEDHYLFPRQDTLFLREERETGRLYRYYRDYFGIGETEKLICDMTLEVGDRFVVPNHCLEERELEVAQVYYDNGIKTILLTGYMDERVFKEGVFPSEYPLWQESVSDLWGYGYGTADWLALLCEYKDGVLVYGDADGCFLNSYKVEEIEQKVAVFPNPTNGVVSIEGVDADEVQVYNALGQMVKTVRGTNEVDMDTLPNGLYLLEIIGQRGVVTKQIIKTQ